MASSFRLKTVQHKPNLLLLLCSLITASPFSPQGQPIHPFVFIVYGIKHSPYILATLPDY